MKRRKTKKLYLSKDVYDARRVQLPAIWTPPLGTFSLTINGDPKDNCPILKPKDLKNRVVVDARCYAYVDGTTAFVGYRKFAL